jgi:phasin family protein
MKHTTDQLIASNQAYVALMKRLTLHSFSNLAKLTELNMETSKALIGGSFHHAQNLMSAKDLQQLLELQMNAISPLSEKTLTYNQHVMSLATDTSAELTKFMENRLGNIQINWSESVMHLMPTAATQPEGTQLAIK